MNIPENSVLISYIFNINNYFNKIKKYYNNIKEMT